MSSEPSHHFWYDRDGKPIDVSTADRLLGTPDYVHVARTSITGPHHGVLVSTVWRAIRDPRIGAQLFETKTFGNPDPGIETRHDTEAEALTAHTEAVAHALDHIARHRERSPLLPHHTVNEEG